MARAELVGSIGEILDDMQRGLFERAVKMRRDNTVEISDEKTFRDFFTSEGENQIHGGFALCHFTDEDAIEPLLKELKVTVRCVPRDNNDQPGTCFYTGQPAEKKAVFAKAY